MWKEMCCLLLLKWVIKYSFENEKRRGINQFEDQPLTHLTHTIKPSSFFHPLLEADRQWFSASHVPFSSVSKGEKVLLNLPSSSFKPKSRVLIQISHDGS